MSRIRTLLIVVGLSVVAGMVLAADVGGAKTRKDAERKLADVALQAYQNALKRYPIDPEHGSLEEIYVWSKRAMEAEPGNNEAANAHLERMVALEKFAIKAKDAIAPWQATAASYYRLEAEIAAGRLEK